MFDGWLSFAGDEVVNLARTQAYLDAGYKPPGVMTRTGLQCDTLSEFLNDGKPYASPIVDNAPWVENNDPDSWDFAGVIPLEITGMQDSMRSASVTELPGGGSVVTRSRFTGRTIGVTALLVGKTGCSVNAGFSWLSAVLSGSCGACYGDELCAWTCCPSALDSSPIPGTSTPEPVSATNPPWTPVQGTWAPGTGQFRPSLLPADDPHLVAPVIECIPGRESSTFTWTLTVPSKMQLAVSVGALDPDTGDVLVREQHRLLTAGTYALALDGAKLGTDWAPTLWAKGGPVKVAATWTHPEFSTVEDCLRDIQRSYLETTCVSGPTVVEQLDFECGNYYLKVEWVWSVGNPYAFGGETLLVDNLSTVVPSVGGSAPGVGLVDIGVVETNLCEVANEGLPEDWWDPCCAGFITPPSLPTIVNDCLDLPTAYHRYAITVPSDYVPVNDTGVLRISVTNDAKPKKGIRLRVIPDPLERGYAAIEECDFCSEFYLSWLPANSTIDIDGARNSVTTTPPGGAAQNTGYSVYGTGGGPFTHPELQCGVGYVILLDVPDTYPETCLGDSEAVIYLAGASQGDLVADIAVRSAAF